MSIERGGILLQLACLFIVLAGLKAAASILIPLLIAIFIATIAYTPITWLTEHKVPLWLSVIVVILIALFALVGVGGVVVQSAIELNAQQQFYEERITQFFEETALWLESLGIAVSTNAIFEVINPGQLWSLALNTVSAIGSTVSSGFLILLVFIFIIAESSSLTNKVNNALIDRGYDTSWITSFAQNLNHYIAIKTVFSLLTGILIGVSLWILGVDFPFLWGMLAFMLNYIPNIGSVIAATPAVLLALIQLGFGYACATVLIFVVVNQVVGTILEPRFLGVKLDMSTLVVFISLIFWGWMFGPVGMVLSVPLTMSIKLAAEGQESTQWLANLLGREPATEPPAEA